MRKLIAILLVVKFDKRLRMCYSTFMTIGILDTEKVKFLLDDRPETIEHAVELIEIEIKTVEFLLSGGIHVNYEE